MGVAVFLRAEVWERQRDAADLVDPQQNLHGTELREPGRQQNLTCALDLLYAGGEGTQATTCRQTDRQTDFSFTSEIDRQTDRETDRQRERDRQTVRQSDRHTVRQTVR